MRPVLVPLSYIICHLPCRTDTDIFTSPSAEPFTYPHRSSFADFNAGLRSQASTHPAAFYRRPVNVHVHCTCVAMLRSGRDQPLVCSIAQLVRNSLDPGQARSPTRCRVTPPRLCRCTDAEPVSHRRGTPSGRRCRIVGHGAHCSVGQESWTALQASEYSYPGPAVSPLTAPRHLPLNICVCICEETQYNLKRHRVLNLRSPRTVAMRTQCTPSDN